MAKQSSERSHSRAKHKARWRRPDAEQTHEDEGQQAAWRKDYYRGPRKDLDRQSTTSWLLEQVGLDEPYHDDSRSYDYRKAAWDEEAASGNPDMSWFLPEVRTKDVDSVVQGVSQAPQDFLDAVAGGSQRDRVSSPQFVRAGLRQELGREPTDEEVANVLASIADDDLQREKMRIALGREPTKEEWLDWLYTTSDPRTRDEKMAGAALALNPLSWFGLSDETAAAAGALFGKDYNEELAKARRIQERYQAYENPLGGRNLAATIGSVAGALGGPLGGSYTAANAGIRGLRRLAGFAPEANTLLGKAVGTVYAGSAAGAADFTAMQMGDAEGDLAQRFAQVDPDVTVGGALLGGVIGPGVRSVLRGAGKGAKSAVSVPSKIIKMLKKKKGPNPQPGTPKGPFGDEPAPQWPRPEPPLGPRVTAATGTPRWRVSDRRGVKTDINRALIAAGVGVPAVGGAAIYGIEKHRQKKARKANY